MQISKFFNRIKQRHLNFVLNPIVSLGISAGVLLFSTSANAAEQVILKYGSFQGTVSVNELDQFVKTGKTTPVLNGYLQASQQNPDVARKALTAGIKADPVFLDSLLSSWAGPVLVNQIGSVVRPPGQELDKQTLRTALSKSIKQSGEVTLLGAIRNYPSATVELEGDRLISVYERLSGLAKIF
ncbi:MAG: alpha/beta hydrolase [Calothrix sp. C42_A2020_038]|nr:alpha/beta hydrolase [Calothrix sp. C42_A2020_038]